MTKIYFAPMEGVTDYVFRRVHHRHFGGVEKYFIPFLSPTHSLTFSTRERNDVLPQNNTGVPAVPQILTNNPDFFLSVATWLSDLGYTELNLNLGCPSGTVTAKKKGSGLLRYPDMLRALLDGIYAHSPLPVSIKTRIGYESTEEWAQLISIYKQYPVHEMIIHPRTRMEFYNGTPHPELCRELPFPFIYNGDIFCGEDCEAMIKELPCTTGFMLGRGLVANPALAQVINGSEELCRESLLSFHDDLYREYLETWPESAAVGKMHLLMKYFSSCFENGDKVLRVLRKATTCEEYENAVYPMFRDQLIRSNPSFRLDLLLS